MSKKKKKFNSTEALHQIRYAGREEEEDDKQQTNGSLRIIRISDINLIPVELMQSLESDIFDPEMVYKLGAEIGSSPVHFAYALADSNHKIQGFLWLSADLLGKFVDVHALTISEKYQGKGIIRKQIDPFIQSIAKQLKFKGYRFQTKRPKPWMKMIEGRESAYVNIEKEI